MRQSEHPTLSSSWDLNPVPGGFCASLKIGEEEDENWEEWQGVHTISSRFSFMLQDSEFNTSFYLLWVHQGKGGVDDGKS